MYVGLKHTLQHKTNKNRRPCPRFPSLQLTQDALVLQWCAQTHRTEHSLHSKPYRIYSTDRPVPIVFQRTTCHACFIRYASVECTTPSIQFLQLVSPNRLCAQRQLLWRRLVPARHARARRPRARRSQLLIFDLSQHAFHTGVQRIIGWENCLLEQPRAKRCLGFYDFTAF